MAFPIAAVLGLAATYAPGIVRYLAGEKAGDVADKVLEVGKAITGFDKPDEIDAALKADPALAVQFRTAMANVELEFERIAAADRDSARRMQIETRSMVPAILSGIVISGFCASCAAILAGHVDGLKDPITAALVGSVFGQISAAAMLVLNFYFGTSSSSKAKDDTIKSLSR